MTTPSAPPFGRALCAMITPFTEEGLLDLDGAQAAGRAAGGRGVRRVLCCRGRPGSRRPRRTPRSPRSYRPWPRRSGAGPRSWRASGRTTPGTPIELALEAEKAGADGLLVVSPYYSKPPQEAVEAHFREIADASGLPLALYDIPGRTGTRIEPETMLRLAEHPRIVAVKDCAYDLLGTQKVLAATEFAYYTGCDEYDPRRCTRWAAPDTSAPSPTSTPPTPGDPGRVRRRRHRAGPPGSSDAPSRSSS